MLNDKRFTVARPCEIFTRLPLKPEAFYDEKEHQSGSESIREFAERMKGNLTRTTAECQKSRTGDGGANLRSVYEMSRSI
jgi:hypothetical protein